jgi:hypothetical protein
MIHQGPIISTGPKFSASEQFECRYSLLARNLIYETRERSDQMAETTTNHDEIRKWVSERGGYPARVKGTDEKGGSGVLRIDYPGYSGEERLEPITWTEFFEGFETEKLAFLYQEETKSGEESRFSKLIDRKSSGH